MRKESAIEKMGGEKKGEEKIDGGCNHQRNYVYNGAFCGNNERLQVSQNL